MSTDPRDAKHARQLPDEVMWQVVCRPDAPTPAPARKLGVSASRIRNARVRIQQG